MTVPSQKDKYIFDVNNYKVIREVKKGGFGVINLVQHAETGAEYAAKTNLIQNAKQNKLYISREVRILMQVQHPTIIQFRGFSYYDFDNKKNITILMDFMKNGSLADLISQEEKSLCPERYDNTKRQIILIGIARGMMILHKHHIIHRDIKPENILLDDNFHPHITDFGLSKFFDPDHSISQSTSDAGTAAYMAPEVINNDKFSTKADVYAFGILMYEVITGKRAYYDLLKGKKKITIFQLKTKVCQGFRPEIKEGTIKKGLKTMIEKCLSGNPSERPTFSEIYRKLSLSSDDIFNEFETSSEHNVINIDQDDDDNTDDDDEDTDDDDGISKTFCLDSVDLNEVLSYVDEVNVEAKSINQKDGEVTISIEEFEGLKKEVESLKSTVSMLQSELEKEKKKNEKFRKKMANLYGQQEGKVDQQPTIIKQHDASKPSFASRFSNDSKRGLVSLLDEKVTLSAGGKHDPSSPISNIRNYDCNLFYNFYGGYVPESESDSTIKFDFGASQKVELNSYFIRTNGCNPSSNSHPKDWRVEGSNDDQNWSLIDKRVDDESLNGNFKEQLFECEEKSGRFRFIRFVQEDSWYIDRPLYIYITYFELYGDVFEC